MGYDLHITRAEHWSDEEPAISAQEWLAYVQEDTELQLAGYNGPYFALWSGKSTYPDPWFDWSRGRVHTKNPDQPIVRPPHASAEKHPHAHIHAARRVKPVPALLQKRKVPQTEDA